MSGLELLESIRGNDKQTPIYMISAYENDQYSRLSQEKGANGFIPKPLDFTELRGLFQFKDTESKSEDS
jgi:DNA-binding response OmpR family regulator